MKNNIFFKSSITQKLGGDHVLNLNKLSLCIVFTAMASAILFIFFLKLMFYNLSNQAIMFLGLAWFIFVGLLDMTIIAARVGKDTYLTIVRLAVIGGFIIIHSAVFELQFFDSDIKSNLANNLQVQRDSIAQLYLPRIRSLDNEIKSISDQNNASIDQVIKATNDVGDEINDGNGTSRGGGRGEIAIAKERIRDRIDSSVADKIAANEIIIEEIKQRRKEVINEKNQALASLTEYKDSGVVSRLNALNIVVFHSGKNGKSSKMVVMFYIAFFVIAASLEALPLIAKRSYQYSVQAYQNRALEESEICNKIENNRFDELLAKQDVRHNIEYQKITETLNIRSKYEIFKEQMAYQFKLRRNMESQIDEILKMDIEGQKKYPKEYYENYYRPYIIEKLLDNFVQQQTHTSA